MMREFLMALFAGVVVIHSELCDPHLAAQKFKDKVLVNDTFPLTYNPYANATSEEMSKVMNSIMNNQTMCGIKYVDKIRQKYIMRTFPNEGELLKSGFIVTHKGFCGACSSLQDLSVYLSINLTAPVKKCTFRSFLFKQWDLKCISNLGFTDACSYIWYYNSLNTKQKCRWVCLGTAIRHKPYNNPDGSLNPCLQCDETKSGPIFHYFAGRMRRNSGIYSSIHRPSSQFYKMQHCYY